MLKAMLGEAWMAMGANRLRTALTMLGMVIGVGAVVIMMAIGQGAQYAVQQTIGTMGSNLYIVLSGSFTTAGVRSGAAGGPTLTVQTVERATNPLYYALIAAFRDLTGVPMVLNTSFNENEPIVNTPEEALDCFLRTRMDRLVLGDWVVVRSRPTEAG